MASATYFKSQIRIIGTLFERLVSASELRYDLLLNIQSIGDPLLNQVDLLRVLKRFPKINLSEPENDASNISHRTQRMTSYVATGLRLQASGVMIT